MLDHTHALMCARQVPLVVPTATAEEPMRVRMNPLLLVRRAAAAPPASARRAEIAALSGARARACACALPHPPLWQGPSTGMCAHHVFVLA
eukprot:CAMPEP_0204590902 /NCGR_PEP_ID=MMETSP0661-20131031/50054_1 /ASSEMBLY_ACC=CAM_ASM_000606 /TAXON_ID=109239 /ORGANISM="Alexandrium margalefi, Strain AMGDE01CS-322" /LENGTH=90 /DNA_ID=CAMNT_0051600973 /DNA_START=154 /DNA_END=422 /DNA_ORIENTATION=-